MSDSWRRGRVRAPKLVGRGGWVNAPEGLSLAALRGKVVLLDFWSFCCINCLHVIEELRPLEERFGDSLVVVGVHSPKFEHEKEHDALERAVARYNVHHPVLDDPDRTTWDQYGVRAWPTLILVDPEGYALAAVAGEGNARALGRTIEEIITYHKDRNTLNEEPLRLPAPKIRSGALRFPGKVAAGLDSLFAVSDSGHNRVVLARLEDGRAGVVAVAGTGSRGASDGGFSDATFLDPQGLLFLDEGTLLVADTGNHLIRKLDLENETVETVAGNGSQARWGASGGKALGTALNSPWDLELWDGKVVIAMAGPHQLWAMDLSRGEVSVLAGSGAESIMDGPAAQAAMAQPSGLSADPDGERLWIVDSETSSLRYLDRSGELHTSIGSGLFDFGYADGPAQDALLQHPLGVVATENGPIVCDTYNSALRRFDPDKNTLTTIARDGLAEPSGAAFVEDNLLVADTNNHRLVLANADGEVSPLSLSGLEPPAPVAAEGPVAFRLGPVELTGEVELSATLSVPQSEKLDATLGPPVQLSVSSEELLPDGGLVVSGDELPAWATLALSGEEGNLDVLLRVGSCEDGAVCSFSEQRWLVEVRRDPEGSPRIQLGLGEG